MSKQITFPQDRSCPLKNRPENAESAQMYSTALQKGTLTFRPKKFISKKSFFVSIFVTPDDSKCHLVTDLGKNLTSNNFENSTQENSFERRKTVSIRLSKMSSEFHEYALPIFLPLIIILAIIVFSAVLFCFKFYQESIHQSCCQTSRNNDNGTIHGKYLIYNFFAESIECCFSFINIKTFVNAFENFWDKINV